MVSAKISAFKFLWETAWMAKLTNSFAVRGSVTMLRNLSEEERGRGRLG